MSKKFKFVLTLPNDIEVDSAEEVDGHMAWPNYSQADPIFYKGIFDSYEKAKEYSSNFDIYKYVLIKEGYDSFKSEDEPIYFISIFDAEDAVCAYLGITPGDPYCEHPDNYTVEETEYEGNKVYKYSLYYEGECVYDSLEEDEYFDTYEEADDEAQYMKDEFDVELGGLDEYYSLEPVEKVNVEIVEFNEDEEDI